MALAGWRSDQCPITNIADLDIGLVIDMDGPSGNAFAIVAAVTRCLKATGQDDMVRSFQSKATNSRTYEAILRLAQTRDGLVRGFGQAEVETMRPLSTILRSPRGHEALNDLFDCDEDVSKIVDHLNKVWETLNEPRFAHTERLGDTLIDLAAAVAIYLNVRCSSRQGAGVMRRATK